MVDMGRWSHVMVDGQSAMTRLMWHLMFAQVIDYGVQLMHRQQPWSLHVGIEVLHTSDGTIGKVGGDLVGEALEAIEKGPDVLLTCVTD